MSKLKIAMYLITMFFFLGATVFAQKKCMFIGADPNKGGKISENAGFDKHIIPVIQEWGYTVDKKHNCQDLPKYTDADYEPYDFIFLSESIHSSQVHPLKNIRKPMLCAEAMATKKSALAFADSDKSTGLLHPGKPVVFLEEAKDHPLAAGYAPGDVAEFGNYRNNCLMTWGSPTIPVISIAGVQGRPQQLTAYGVEKGTKNSDGEVINHRVSVVGTHAWCYKSNAIGEPMIKLMKAGIKWILEGETTASANKKVNADSSPFGLFNNEFNQLRTITYTVPNQSHIRLTVFNNRGQKVQTLVNGLQSAGKHTVKVDASKMSKGIYLLALEAENAHLVKQVFNME